MRSKLVVLVLVLLCLLAFLWSRPPARPDGDAVPPAGERMQAEARRGDELAAAGSSAARVAAPEDRAQGPALPAPPDDLLASLRRLGELYVDFAQATQSGRLEPELERELRALLEPIVNHPEVPMRILGLLQSGDLVRRTADGAAPAPATLSLEETGAFWSLFWTFASYNAPGALLRPGVAVDGRGFALDLFGALPWIRPETALQLARHLLNATDAEGEPILDRRFLDDLLVLARAHPDVAALRELLLGLAERLDAVERLEILRFYLPLGDPDRLIAEIKGYLGGASEAQGILMASMQYEAEPDDELRSRIAVAVLGGAADPFAAAGFLAQHGDALRNDPTALHVMGSRADGAAALEAEYQFLLGAGADARARLALVLAMKRTPPSQLLELARNEPEHEVRATALYRAVAGRDEDPSDEALALLHELGERRDAKTTVVLIDSASGLAKGFRRVGKPDSAREATQFLETVARDPSTGGYARDQALKALRSLMAKADYEALLAEAPAGD